MIREKVMTIRDRAINEAHAIASNPCPLSVCDIDMLYKLIDIAKDTYEMSKTAMEVEVLAENAAAKKCELNPHS